MTAAGSSAVSDFLCPF
jgi:translation initiation factor 3 subunit J